MIDTSVSNCEAGVINLRNIDNSVNETRRFTTRISANKVTQKGTFVVTSKNDSDILSLRTMRTTNLEAADKAAKKKMPRLKLGVNDLMKSVKVKLEQTLYRLEILQELKYEPTLYAPFQEQWDIRSAEYEALKQSKPAVWNVVKSISYLSDVCALKAEVKALYERCVTASEQKRQKNLKTLNYQRCQKDVKASLSSVPGPDWIPILEKFLDSDDELSDDSNEDNEDNDEGNEDDEDQGERTPRCAAFGAGISR